MKCDSSGGICTEVSVRKYRQYIVLNTILQLMCVSLLAPVGCLSMYTRFLGMDL